MNSTEYIQVYIKADSNDIHASRVHLCCKCQRLIIGGIMFEFHAGVVRSTYPVGHVTFLTLKP